MADGKVKYEPLEYVSNPRDLVGDFAAQIEKLDPKAQYVVIVTDPRDRQCNTMHSHVRDCVTRDAMVRQVVNVLMPPPEDQDSEDQDEVEVE